MKKVFLLLCAMLATTTLLAQDYYVFADKDGNVFEDGTTIQCTKAEDDGFGTIMLPSGLYVKNADAPNSCAVSVVANITKMESGLLQLCFPMNCSSYSTVGLQAETEKETLTQGQVKNLMTEWLPTAYGECTVIYTLRTYQSILRKNERTITVNYRYADPASVSLIKSNAAIHQGIFNLQGCRQQQLSRGINIVRRSNGTIRKISVTNR